MVALAVDCRRPAQTDVRTPRSPAMASAARSDTRGYAGFSGAESSSVVTCPGAGTGIPEATTSGRPDPASTSPIASMARPSVLA